MRATILSAVAVLSTTAGAIAPAQGVAQSGSRQSAELRFAERTPGTPTAATFEIDYVDPTDPSGKPEAVRQVIGQFATGARIDTSVPERCGASDPQLVAQGAAACPPGSRVGGGTVRIDTGFPEPNRFLQTDVVLINAKDELIFLFTDRASGARVPNRAAVRGGDSTVTNAPPLPGTPPDGAAVDVVKLRIDAVSRQAGGARVGYLTTPPSCPKGGHWTNTARFTYHDGVSQAVPTDSACDRSGGAKGRCANAWNGSRGSDRHSGTGKGDRLLGLRGDDRLRGRRGGDCLHGQSGDDELRGGRGRDLLLGGRGFDTCVGGPGRDRFRGCELIR
jgi:hypothetical protein